MNGYTALNYWTLMGANKVCREGAHAGGVPILHTRSPFCVLWQSAVWYQPQPHPPVSQPLPPPYHAQYEHSVADLPPTEADFPNTHPIIFYLPRRLLSGAEEVVRHLAEQGVALQVSVFPVSFYLCHSRPGQQRGGMGVRRMQFPLFCWLWSPQHSTTQVDSNKSWCTLPTLAPLRLLWKLYILRKCLRFSPGLFMGQKTWTRA